MASKKKKGGAGGPSVSGQAVKTAAKKTAPKKPAVPKAAKKPATKKTAAKKSAFKKSAVRKAAAKKTAAAKARKKPAAKKATATGARKKTTKSAAAKKAAVKKATLKKATSKKVAPKKSKPKKTAAAKKAPRRKPAARKPAARKPAARKTAAAKAAGARTSPRRRQEAPVVPPGAIPGLSEEDQIRSAKYLPRELPKRLFEEDRFLFPESYGVNRVRLLVRDPEWVFAYWDVSAETMKGLARSLGERAFKLSRLTLRVLDPVSGGTSDILLPSGSRWWYIRTDTTRRTYRAEIGITLPSGEFRRLAESNAVVTPRVGPSRERARRRLSYAGAGDVPPEEAAAAGKADRETGLATGPWAGNGETADSGEERGGASESFRPARPGGEDRPGASDTYRR